MHANVGKGGQKDGCVRELLVHSMRADRTRSNQGQPALSDELLAVRGCQNPQRAGDVIFVHGLNGNPFGYWAHDGKRDHWWPEWLGEDLPNVGIWSLGYENAAFKSR